MRSRSLVAVATTAVLAATVGASYALDGKNGYDASEAFVWGAIRDSIHYDASFTGVPWGDLPGSGLGAPGPDGGHMAANASGDLFFLVWGDDVAANEVWYNGLVRYDGTGFTHLYQDVRILDALGDGSNYQRRTELNRVTVSPVTAGRLVAGRPVAVRTHYDGPTNSGYGEIVTFDPDSSPPALTVVHRFDDHPAHWPTRVVVADTGNLYVFDIAVSDSIVELSWDATAGAYAERVVPTTAPIGRALSIGPDGYLYTSRFNQSWFTYSDQEKDILRVDPATGAWSVYGQVIRRTAVHDWVWDSEGTLWVALTSISGKRVVSYVPAGGRLSLRNAITDSGRHPYSLAAGPDGELFVQEWVDQNGVDSEFDVVFHVVPAADGGGGNGNGKGKNK